QDELKGHYEAAEASRRSGNIVEAQAEYRAALAEAYHRLGVVHSALKEYKEAVPAFESAISNGSASAPVLVDLAVAYFDLGRFNDAFEPLNKALAFDPRSAGAHEMLGKCYFMHGDFDKAKSELDETLRLQPGDYDASYMLGLVLVKKLQLAPAKEIFDQMLARLGDSPQLHIIFGRVYRDGGYLENAVEEFQKAAALDPKFPGVHYYLGLTYLLKDGASKLDQAADEFKIELVEHPDQFFANYSLGVIYLNQRKWDIAVSFLEKAAKIQPENPDPFFDLGQAYQTLGQHERAIEVLRKSIALTPDLAHNDYQVTTAHYRLAQSLLKTGKTEDGRKELRISSDLKAQGFKRDEDKAAAAEADPAAMHSQSNRFKEISPAEGTVAEAKDPDEKTKARLKATEDYCEKVIASAHENIGLIMAGKEDYAGAAGQFALAAKFNPELEHIFFNWGLAAYKAGALKDAIVPLEKQLALDPTSISVKQLLGTSYFAAENYEKAAELLSVVIEAKPSEASLYYPLALSLVKLGRTEAADQMIQRMMATSGNSAEAHILLAEAYQQEDDPTRALDELKAALALNDRVPLAHFYSGLIYVKMGKMDDAAREFESEVAIDGNNIEAKYHLAFVLLANQKTDKGIALMKEVVRIKPDYAQAHYELGKALLKQGETAAAVEQLEIAVKLQPDEPYSHYQLGRAYLAAGKRTEGDQQLEAFKRLKDGVHSDQHQ
ncbi:MAG TPA: tetratricopeptide repeat protein, partial [Blastocatellia bacterium]